MKHVTRRKFVKSTVGAAAAAAAGTATLQAQQQPANRVSGYDHVALPMVNDGEVIVPVDASPLVKVLTSCLPS